MSVAVDWLASRTLQLARVGAWLPAPRQWVDRLAGRLATPPRRRRPAKVSLPLATALVAGIAAIVLLLDLDLDRDVWRGERAALGAAEVVPPVALPISTVALLPALADLVPEPAAGPAPRERAAAVDDGPAGRRALPEIPDVPMELDDIARELQRRRTEVLELQAALALREAAVRAAEADLAAQVDRLEAFKRQLEALVGEAEAEEEERLQQLVRMYESMRAKSAAAIFDRLELPVILAVAERMREARMAAILAAMDPARARVVTSELARERELPRLD